MNTDQKWIVEHFLQELQGMNFTEVEQLYKIELRNKHAEMITTELSNDDPIQHALRVLAEVVSDPVFSPHDLEELTIYNRVLLKALAAALGI